MLIRVTNQNDEPVYIPVAGIAFFEKPAIDPGTEISFLGKPETITVREDVRVFEALYLLATKSEAAVTFSVADLDPGWVEPIEKGAELVYLESVAAFINVLTGETFASNADETPDESSAVHVLDLDMDFFVALSSEDRSIVNGVLEEQRAADAS